MKLAHERPADELHGDDALAKIEAQLRQAMPSFHLRVRVRSLTVSRAPRGVFVDIGFAPGGDLPRKVRCIVSRAWAESLRGQLSQVLDA